MTQTSRVLVWSLVVMGSEVALLYFCVFDIFWPVRGIDPWTVLRLICVLTPVTLYLMFTTAVRLIKDLKRTK